MLSGLSRQTQVGARDDTIRGAGGKDVIRAGEDNDIIVVPRLSFADVDGDSGIDMLVLQGAGRRFDLTTLG